MKLGWVRDGVTHSATVTLDARQPLLQTTQTVGNARVEIQGATATWTRDPRTGALQIQGDQITVTVKPPPR